MNRNRMWHLLGACIIAGLLLLVITFELGDHSITARWNSRPRPALADGTVITVTTDSDVWTNSCADDCTLREAIAQTNGIGGSEPVTITFAADYVITLTHQTGGQYAALPSINRLTGPVYIDGDRDDDGQADVVVNGQNLAATGSTGLWLKSDGVTVDGVIVRNVDCAGCWGLDIHGDDALVVNSRFLNDDTGIYLTNDADHNVITHCIIADNNYNGILVSAQYVTSPSLVITPAHHNTIANSYIGTNADGDDLGNGGKGIVIQRGAHSNTLQDNVIAYNGCYAIYLRGGLGTPSDPFAPPNGNQVLDNDIHDNGASCDPQAAVVNERTHQAPGDVPTLSGGYDNLFAGNIITRNTGMGIYNLGASPLITGNEVANNTSYGIYNLPHFGSDYSPANASDDILSIPIIQHNTVDRNGATGIRSLDTAPADRYTLHQDNTIGIHSEHDVLQMWYGTVEVLTGTTSAPQPITQGISVRVMGNGTGWLRDLTIYAPAAAYNSGIWGDTGLLYGDVRTWPGIREFEVLDNGTLVNHLTHTVQVHLNGVYTGFVHFSFDGLTTTAPISGDARIPQWNQSGPYGRYQVAEVNFTYDSDHDTIPDVVEGADDTDNDGIPDYVDVDADGDSIPDAVEGTDDPDQDGLPNYLDTDSDGDGIPDVVEGNVDTDHDGKPDYLDTDADGDGTPDQVEGTADTDGDGLPDYVESNTQDTDGDGLPDYQDTDADGDGTPDSVEGTDDADGDGIPNYLDVDSDGAPAPGGDSDGDLLPDGVECPAGFPCTDSDGDKKPDYMETDADGDGILDRVEAGADPVHPVDTDSDQVPDYRDLDSDGDSVPDATEGTTDTDRDSKPNYRDNDDDGDGILTANEYNDPSNPGDNFCTNTTLNTDADATCNCQDNDVDGDGTPNYLDTDSDGDRTLDSQERPPASNSPPFQHGDVPAWIDPLYRARLPIVVRAFSR